MSLFVVDYTALSADLSKMKTIRFFRDVLAISMENLAEIDLFLPKLHRHDGKDISISHWRVGSAKKRETTRFSTSK